MLAVAAIPTWLMVNLRTVTNGIYTWKYEMPSSIACKFYVFIWNITAIMSSWTIITFSVERCLVIWKPIKMVPIFSSSKPRKMALSSIFVFSVIVSSFHFRWIELRPTGEGTFKCTMGTHFPTSEVIISNIIAFVLANGAPIVIIIVLNLTILIGIHHNRMEMGKKSSKTDLRASVNLMLVAFFYILFITPFQVTHMMFNIYDAHGFENFFTQREFEDFIKIVLTADGFAHLNYCTNPWIYVFSLKFYRSEVKNLSCKCVKSKNEMNNTE